MPFLLLTSELNIPTKLFKQIQKVLDNTTGMYGSIRGISGSAVGNIVALELPYPEEKA